MTLIATGDVLRNRALQGLEYMSQEEAERERLRQQIKQAESAQKAQLAGTGLGIAGAAGVRYYGDEIRSGLSGIFGGGASAPALSGDAVLSGGKLLTNASPVATPSAGSMTAGQALTAASNPSAVGALASPAGTVGGAGAGGSVAGGTAGATTTTSGALATGGGTVGGAAAQGAATTAPAGGLTFGAIAAPLAIGIGAYFLLNALFD